MNAKIEFEATLLKHAGMDACYVEFPYNVEELFGTKGQVKVKAYIENELYRGSLANMGTGRHALGITKAIRKKIGKGSGDTLHITLERDLDERTVEIPDYLEEFLKNDDEMWKIFEKLSFTNKRGQVQRIVSAKRIETKMKRISELMDKLDEKRKLSKL